MRRLVCINLPTRASRAGGLQRHSLIAIDVADGPCVAVSAFGTGATLFGWPDGQYHFWPRKPASEVAILVRLPGDAVSDGH